MTDRAADRHHLMTARRRRVAACAALVLAAATAVALVAFLVSHVLALLVGMAGAALVVGGGWWAVTELMPRRAIGGLGVAAGLVLVVVAAAMAMTGNGDLVIAVVVLVVLMGGALAGARAAMVHDLHESGLGVAVTGERVRPERPVLICNPWSGGGKVERFGLVALAEAKGVEVVMLDHGLDLEQLARDAVARGAGCLAMAGGDGSQALVASIAVEHDLPFVCISAGTRNHFALDLGLDRDDPRASLDAFDDGVERRIDYATMGDRFFVNNVSFGVYATIVQEDSYREAKVDTTKELLPTLLGRGSEPFDLQFTDGDGTEVDGAFLVQVSNNPYVIGASFDAAQRRRLDTGRLGVVAISTRTGSEAVQLMMLSSVGQRTRSPRWHEFETDRFVVRSRSGTAAVGVDGEALVVPTPVEMRIHPQGLRLIVPHADIAMAEKRRAREVDVGRLWDIAVGRVDPVPQRQP